MKNKLLLPVVLLLALGAQGSALVAAEHAPVQKGYVRLLASDETPFDVKKDIAFLSQTLSNVVGDLGEDDVSIDADKNILRVMIKIMRVYYSLDKNKIDEDNVEQELLRSVVKKKLLKANNVEAVLKLANFLDFDQHQVIMDVIIYEFARLKLANYKNNPVPINHRPEGYDGEVLELDVPDELLETIAKIYFIRERFEKNNLAAVPLKLTFNCGFSIEELASMGQLPAIDNNELILSNLLINSLDGLQDVEGIKNLEELSLHNNQINALSVRAFAGPQNSLKSLKIIRLYDNNITDLPSSVFTGLLQLHRLELHEPGISEEQVQRLQQWAQRKAERTQGGFELVFVK